jgi:hypothetical protein
MAHGATGRESTNTEFCFCFKKKTWPKTLTQSVARSKECMLGAAPFFAPLKVRTPAQAIFGVAW